MVECSCVFPPVCNNGSGFRENKTMMEEQGEYGAPQDLAECSTCNRSFNRKVLEKHAKICQKSMTKRRRVFDSSRQRAEGTDIPVLKPMKPKSQSTSATGKAEPPKKPSNWRRKHEDFIATIRAAKMLTQVIKDGGPLPPPPPPTYDPDYVQCPFCQRRFNEAAAERHIKFCQEKAACNPNKGKLGEAKKTPGRTQYKPPGPVKKTNSTIPSASTRLPQRSPLGQPTGIPASKASSAGLARTNPSGITSPPSGSIAGLKQRAASSSYGSARNAQPRVGLNKKKVDNGVFRSDFEDGNEVDNSGGKSKFCHNCGTKYPVESAKFCCECGIRRMGI